MTLMRYQGGKSRIASEIANAISRERKESNCFVSLFCGSCSVESKIIGFDKKKLVKEMSENDYLPIYGSVIYDKQKIHVDDSTKEYTE